MSEPIYTLEQYLKPKVNPAVITTEVLVLILNQDHYFKRIVKHQNYEAQEYGLEDCIDKCIDYMRDHGLFFVTTPEERRKAAILFLNAEE
tara:strand:- start:142 stop:411 length:270 start_codon:yes stop_codon:yes gene_type:complete